MRPVAIVLAVTVAVPALAQEHNHVVAEKLGSVHFDTSCRPGVAPEFNRGVARLHSFEFGAAIRSFTTVLAGDSTCAMAAWGIALSRWTNPMRLVARPPQLLQQGRDAAESAQRLSPHATVRERLYITAVGELYRDYERVDQASRVRSYARAMADLVAAAPADTEAKIFYALAIAAAAPPGDKSYASQLQAGAILEPLFARQPDHPGLAHYIIHTYDAAPLAARAAGAAARYAEIAPSVAHALHMPSHTFTRLGAWEESSRTNQRAVEAALAGSDFGEVLHASDYLEYAYLQLGQDSAARVVRDRAPGYYARLDPDAIVGAANVDAAYYAHAAIPARFALERRDWGGAAALAVVPMPQPWANAITYFARAIGRARLGQVVMAQGDVDSLAAIERRLAAAEPYWSDQVGIQRLGAAGWLAVARGRPDSAALLLREAARREDATEKSVFTPGPLAPAREMLGDLLLELKQPSAALAEYRVALSGEPNRFRSLYGAMRAARASGESVAAAGYHESLRVLWAHADASGREEFTEMR